MPTLADLLGNIAASDQSSPFFPYRMTSPWPDFWSPERSIDSPQLPTFLAAFAGLSPHIDTPPSNSTASLSSGGILGPIFGNGGNANGPPPGGILQNLSVDPPQKAPEIWSTGSLLSPFNSQTPQADPIGYGAASLLSTAGRQTISGSAQGLPRISGPSSPARVDEQQISINPPPRPAPYPSITEDFPSPKVPLSPPATIAASVTTTPDARASGGTLSGKAPDPDFGRRYAQIIASDPDLSTAVRMAEKAGDATFKDWLATVLRDLEHSPAAALEAIRQATFSNYVRAETRGTAAEAILNLAVRKAALRLDDLNRGQGVERARYQGFRAAVDLSEDQRHVLYTITSNPNLSVGEKLDRMAEAGLFDAALASSFMGLGGFGNGGALFGPADRPGGSGPRFRRTAPVEPSSDEVSGSRIRRSPPLGVDQDADLSGRPSTAAAVARTTRADVRRSTPGIISGNGTRVDERWLGDMDAPVPAQVATLLRGRNVRDMDHFRNLFWRAVSSFPELAAQFSPQNRSLMSRGLAPRVPLDQRGGEQLQFHLHHIKRVADDGPLYDLENIRVVSPLRHQQIHKMRSP